MPSSDASTRQGDDWTRFHHFLRFGSEAGVYYAAGSTPRTEDTPATLRCIASDAGRVIGMIRRVSRERGVPPNDPLLFAFALVTAFGDDSARRSALDALPDVCRAGSELFRFARFVGGMRGWGRGLRAAIGRWYGEQSVRDVAYQVVKYKQDEGWTHRDLLRLAHPKADVEARRILYHWIAQGWERIGDTPHDQKDLQIIWAMEKARLPGTTPKTVAELIRVYELPLEAVPPGLLGERVVWEALLERMPLGALIRHLPDIARVGVLDSRTWQGHIMAQITDIRQLGSSRLHPLAVLAAQRRYAHGREGRKHSWTPVTRIVDALDAAFYATFGNAPRTGKRLVVTLDVSPAMDSPFVTGAPGLTPRDATCAMALVAVATEPETWVLALGETATLIEVAPGQRLEELVKATTDLPGGTLDRAYPMLWASERRVEADGFVTYTGTGNGSDTTDPAQALRRYRGATGIPARLALVGMKATSSGNDWGDVGMLDVVGFDVATPDVITGFLGAWDDDLAYSSSD